MDSGEHSYSGNLLASSPVPAHGLLISYVLAVNLARQVCSTLSTCFNEHVQTSDNFLDSFEIICCFELTILN